MILNKKLENYWLILLSLPLWECGLKCKSKVFSKWTISVAPFVGVWIEIPYYLLTGEDSKSLPLWECGLKYVTTDYILLGKRRSLCGSLDWNHHNRMHQVWLYDVAPFVGVWIEMSNITYLISSVYGRSLCGSVDWNILDHIVWSIIIVAPFVGVWIEIYTF